MKIAYYCQHVLGIGHFHRSLEICRELARHHEVRLIVGGPPVEEVPENIGLYRLPGLRMDEDFQNLAPCDPGLSLAEVKEQRRGLLLDFFQTFRPEAFLVELYPFGRKAFRFELDPLLTAIREGTLPPCRCFVSLRDILVERPDDRDRFENRAVATLNRFFDGLLIHADNEIITLNETFGRCADIRVPIAYTGFVSRQAAGRPRAEIRRELRLAADDRLIVVSIGGGSVGYELLQGAIAAFSSLTASGITYHMQLFSGPYLQEELFHRLRENLPPKVTLDRFSTSFPDWLQAADLSISMAGYNTCMNILQAGIPALVYPFAQNREQSLRAMRLGKKATIRLLEESDLVPEPLAALMQEMSGKVRFPTAVNLQGAAGTREQIEHWCREV